MVVVVSIVVINIFKLGNMFFNLVRYCVLMKTFFKKDRENYFNLWMMIIGLIVSYDLGVIALV